MSGAAASSEDLTQHVPCPCGEWEFRVSESGIGPHTANKRCPRCGNYYLVVFRGHALLGVAELHGRDVGSMRQALGEIDQLHPWERRALLMYAQGRAKSLPKRHTQEAGGA